MHGSGNEKFKAKTKIAYTGTRVIGYKKGRKLRIKLSYIRKEKKKRDPYLRKMMKNQGNNGSSGNLSIESEYEDETLASFRAKEEEIEKKKLEVREKVEYQLGRAEEETRRLAQVWNVSIYMAKFMRNSDAHLSPFGFIYNLLIFTLIFFLHSID